MPRQIDRLPEPTQKRPLKIIGVSASRTGTLGIYKALKVLGYRPYHMVEVCDSKLGGGIPHIRTFREACKANNSSESGIKPYGRAEFDKWFADFDCVLEIPSYLDTSVIDAYKDEPDIKFILTERKPEAFARSFSNSVGLFVTAISKLPLSLFQYFDMFNWEFFRLNEELYEICSRGVKPMHPFSNKNLQIHYMDYIKAVKKSVPKERLLVVQLEEGLGWEQICPFLGHDIPDIKYPRGNDANEFKGMVENFMSPGINKALTLIGATVAAGIGAGAWLLKVNQFLYWYRYTSLPN